MPRVSVVLCYFILLTASTVNSDCDLTFGGKWKDKKQPMLLKNGHPVETNDKKIKFRNGESVDFACPGPKNILLLTNTEVFAGVCAGGDNFNLGGNIQPFSNIQCKNRITAKPVNLKQCCSQGGTWFEIGFFVQQSFFQQFYVCYDLTDLNPLFSAHEIDGRTAGFSTTSSDEPDFSTEGLGKVGVNSAYTQEAQKVRFNLLLGSATKAGTYIKKNSYFARGHLAPKTHFVFSYEQYATFFYLNVAPQWQQVNNANWKSVELTLRSFIEMKKDLFEIITGTHGVLSLEDANDNLVPIYLLSGNRMPVPNYIWKIVNQRSTGAAIVFVQINNPFILRANVQNQIFCTNVCSVAGFDKPNWSDETRGFVFCCQLSDFLRVVGTAPPITASSLLRNV